MSGGHGKEETIARTPVQTLMLIAMTLVRLIGSPLNVFCLKKVTKVKTVAAVNSSFLSSFGCIYGLPLYYWQAKKYSVEKGMPMGEVLREPFKMRMYYHLIVGGMYAIIMFTAITSMSKIDGAVFSILRNSQLVFTLVLSYIFTKRKFKPLHYVAVAIMIASTVILMTLGKDETKHTKDVSASVFYIGCFMCFASAFMTALMAVLMELWFSKRVWDRSGILLFEAFFWEAVIVTGFMGIFSLTFPLMQWSTFFQEAIAKSDFIWKELSNLHSDGTQVAEFYGLIFALSLGRFLNLTHLGVSAFSGALYAWVLSSLQRVTQLLMFVVLMSEPFNAWKGVAAALTFVAFGVYMRAGIDKVRNIK